MLTLTLPAHGSYEEILSMIQDCSMQIKIMRDATVEMPELQDDFSYARGKTAISRELEQLEDFRQQWCRYETESCPI
jgi:hypothetical protein